MAGARPEKRGTEMKVDEIVVVDSQSPKPFPPARKLLELGLSPQTVARWKRVRREFTRELPARVKRDVN